jgi:hypothetical protein
MQSSNQVYQAPPSTIQNITGLGLGAAGIASLMKADGGMVHDYADGGSVKTYAGNRGSVTSSENVKKIVREVDSDQDLQTALEAAAARRDMETVQAIQQEMAFRASMRNGLASAVTPDMSQNMVRAAGGGILAFASPTASNNYSLVTDPEERDELEERQVYSPGDPKAFRGFNQEIMRSMGAIRNQQPKTMSEQDYNKAISNRYAMLGKLAGPDPYADSLTDLGEQEKGIAGMGNIAKAAALFKGARAAVEGNDAMRGITGAGAAVGEGLAQAARAEALERRSLNNAKLAIKDSQRKERMGMTRESIGAADDARRSISEANKFELEKQKTLGTLAAQAARANKPTGTGAGAKERDQAQAMRVFGADLKRQYPDMPLEQIEAQALQKFLEQKSPGLPGVDVRTDAATQKEARTSFNNRTMFGGDSLAKEYRAADKAGDAAKAAELKARIAAEEGYKLPGSDGKVNPNGVNPAGAPPSISTVTGAPKGAKIGEYVQGKGYEVKDSKGTLIGYAQGQ